MDGRVSKNSEIGIFDSGAGGTSIWWQCRSAMPNESYISLADNARFPFGSKSRVTVIRYSRMATERLRGEGVKAILCACNTVCVNALEELRESYPQTIWVGVVDSAVEEAVMRSPTQRIGVLSTESTAASGAFPAAIQKLVPDCKVQVVGAGVLVSVAEQGWTEGHEVDAVLSRYVNQLEPCDTLILGCTHFGLLESAIRQKVGPKVHVINSARASALALRRRLEIAGLRSDRSSTGQTRFWVTDTPCSFRKTVGHFLNGEGEVPEIEHIDLPFAPACGQWGCRR